MDSVKSRSRRNRRLVPNESSRTALRCGLALALVIALGTCGFTIIEEEWSVWQSLFFTLITVTTVGYGDENISQAGEAFAAVLLLFGIGTATYSLSSLVQIAISYQADWKRAMQKEIDQLSSHFVICGFGRMGQTVCEELHAAGMPLVVIDCEPATFERAVDQGFLAVQGNSAEEQVLHAAGIDRARGVICVSGNDAENMFITLTARDMNQQALVVSRASSTETARRMERAGASLVVSPYVTAGMNIADAILRPKFAEFLSKSRRDGCDFELTEFTVPEGSPFTGKEVKEVGMAFPSVVFVALQRPGQRPQIRPGGNKSLEVGDKYTIAGHPSDLEQILAEAATEIAADAVEQGFVADAEEQELVEIA